ncbi:MAG: glycosyltransferase [Bacteroidia bacterium]|nr:glycosyltransferase [Bacteroidia bacterium]MCF8428423.1 glycosyltransferase [Bacteroidia bacterium]
MAKEKEFHQQELVTIIIVCYNSAQTVLETLESACQQTYSHLELILTDDASTDDTLSQVQTWINEKGNRFVRTQLISHPINTGIPANCNRGVKAAKGKFLKLIAGDDILATTCIEHNMEFIEANLHVQLVVSNILSFNCGNNHLESKKLFQPLHQKLMGLDANSEKQYQAFLKEFMGATPSFFIKKSVLEHLNYFDEKYPFIEDYPFALNATKAGFCFYYLNKVTVYYRISQQSVYGSRGKKAFNNFYQLRLPFDQEYRFPLLPTKQVKKELFEYHRLNLLNHLGLNHKNLPCLLIKKITYYFNPYLYL